MAHSELLFCRLPSPLGELRLAASESGLRALCFAGQRYEARHIPPGTPEGESAVLHAGSVWLAAYFSGNIPDTLPPLDPVGTPFERRVWAALLDIPYGETRSYAWLAARLATSPRAIGGAVGRNPLSILIPCHRVLGANGSLTGYAGGIERKQWLLDWETINHIPRI